MGQRYPAKIFMRRPIKIFVWSMMVKEVDTDIIFQKINFNPQVQSTSWNHKHSKCSSSMEYLQHSKMILAANSINSSVGRVSVFRVVLSVDCHCLNITSKVSSKQSSCCNLETNADFLGQQGIDEPGSFYHSCHKQLLSSFLCNPIDKQ